MKNLGPAEPGKVVPPYPLTPAENRRRADLIGRNIDGTITPAEAEELAHLQRVTLEWGEAYHEATRGDFQRAKDRELAAIMARLQREEQGRSKRDRKGGEV